MTGFTKEEIAELLETNIKDIVDEDIDCFNEVFFRDEALYRNLCN